MRTYIFRINGEIVQYTHETLGQAFREAKADNPGAVVEKQRGTP